MKNKFNSSGLGCTHRALRPRALAWLPASSPPRGCRHAVSLGCFMAAPAARSVLGLVFKDSGYTRALKLDQRTHIHPHQHTYTCMRAYIHTYIHTACIHTYIHTYIQHAYIHNCTFTRARTNYCVVDQPANSTHAYAACGFWVVVG